MEEGIETKALAGLFQGLTNTSEAILIVLDHHCRVEYWSPNAADFFHIQEEAVRGKPLSYLDLGGVEKHLGNALEESRQKRWQVYLPDLPFTPQGEDLHYIGLNIIPIFDCKSHHTGYIVDGKDISDQRERREREEEDQKFRALGELAAGIIHEINTPVQYIKNNLRYLRGSLQEDHLPEKYEDVPDVLDQSLEGIDRISGIITSLRNYVHPGNEEGERFDLLGVVHDALTLSENQWKRLCSVETDLPPEPLFCTGFPSLISQALMNIVINAAHAIEERYGEEALDKGRVLVRVRDTADGHQIQIEDNGKGMSEEVRLRIFEPFFTTKERGRGTGQGLAIVYSVLVRKHKAKIKVQSSPGEGTAFYILLPKDRG